MITLLLSFFASAAAGRTAIEIVRFTTFNNLLRLSRALYIFALFSDKLSRNNCIRLTTNLLLNIYKNFTFFRSLLRWERKKEEKGVGRGRCQLNEELIDIQNLNYQNYVNSQIILPAKKLTNSERQARDGGRHNEERCILKHKQQHPKVYMP